MRVLAVLGAGMAVAALLWVGPAAQVQPFPGPGTGVVTVTGNVNVANTPGVEATQRGEWKVAVTNTPAVSLAGSATVELAIPEFIRRSASYDVVWPNGDRETVFVSHLGPGGWIRVQAPGGQQRWINLAQARAVQEGR